MFTLYSADFINAPSNCSYPHKVEVTDPASFAEAVSRDYVCAEYMNAYCLLMNTTSLSFQLKRLPTHPPKPLKRPSPIQ